MVTGEAIVPKEVPSVFSLYLPLGIVVCVALLTASFASFMAEGLTNKDNRLLGPGRRRCNVIYFTLDLKLFCAPCVRIKISDVFKIMHVTNFHMEKKIVV